MNKFDRLYDLYRILRDRRTPIQLQSLAERLECSKPTVKRTIQKLREEFGAPITTMRGRGYLLADDGKAGLFELPGLWFNASELHALLSAHHLLSQVEPGILSEEIAPLRRRIGNILQHRRAGSGDLVRRVRIEQTGSRPVDKHRFRQACTALMRRRQLAIAYHARGTDQHTERQVSPQRLTHYRSNWYLDAWCHRRKAMRSFAFERIERLEALQQPAHEISDDELKAFSHAYGIFSGPGRHQAVLRCSPERARWLAEEQWHPDQAGRWLPDGHYELTLPYNNPTELIMDILRHGPEVEVVRPKSLRQSVAETLERTLDTYRQ
ncbi:WYL domain-containing protein [Wenzhouxiangella sp. AB-CW3]|uniref:helix-turn-helix transcriptional regulator n=1 Tax=Wenzhouxiangella sp. AB-CW3 TaxID=2771012 RepID=UPI00168BCD73|nr:WYL domain-containing protein [Wenzhouxiangella sp. AB-CW3]QOC21483.1 WYL domain-containing protein [Wenzhouxiangella sp. AB-CW3]